MASSKRDVVYHWARKKATGIFVPLFDHRLRRVLRIVAPTLTALITLGRIVVEIIGLLHKN